MISFKEYKHLQETVEINPVKNLEHSLVEKYPEVEKLRLYPSGKHDIKLDTIIVKKEHRKTGVGSKVLHEIKQFADKHAKRIILTAGVRDKHWGTTSHSRLDTFYKRNGFVANKGRNKDYTITATHYYKGKGHINESTEEHPMIDVDGEMKHRNNSDGQPIHPTDEGIRNFHRWFGDSKIVDKHGRPIPYYRGSKNDNAEAYNNSSMIFVSPSPEFAKHYARDGQTFKLYVKSDKPFDASRGNGLSNWKKYEHETNAPSYALTGSDRGALPGWQQEHQLRKWLNNNVDHDSIYFGESDRSHSIAVKNINQLKSAIGNYGTFSHQTEINESIEHPMIDVDGVSKHRNNSLGQPIHHTDEGIKNFHRWFGDSKSIDEHGRPVVLYHGTGKDFDKFDNSKTGSNDMGLWGKGHYFSAVSRNADSYALRQDDSVILPTYVSVKNPLILTTGSDLITRLPDGTNYKNLVGQNLDGSKIKAIAKAGNHDGTMQIKPDGKIGDLVAYDSSQIKSAIGNSGSFSHQHKITECKDYTGQHYFTK